jgi:HAD superfamily hydrolase (TIGR01458 family)
MKKNTIIFDLNGTLYEKGIAVDGAIKTIEKLRENGFKLNFVTNTDGRKVLDVLKKVNQMGFDIKEDELLTPVSAAKDFIECNKDKTFYLLTHDDVKEDLSNAVTSEQPDYVIIGDFSDKLSMAELNKVFRMIDAGAKLVSLSNTSWYYSSEGKAVNTGAFVKMFEELTNKKAILLGKPSVQFLATALNRTKARAEETIVIGDDILTDILGGNNLGATTVQVKTGVYNEEISKSVEIKPDFVITSVAHIFDII